VLSNKEALSLLTGASLEVSEELLQYCGHNLNELARLQICDLMRVAKIKESQAARIVAAFEIGNRKQQQDTLIRNKVAGSRDIFEFMQFTADIDFEEFHVIILNRANRIVKEVKISEGGISGTVADPKKIFKMGLDLWASGLILCHNHPSGNPQPSEADIHLTKKLIQAGLLLDMPVIDHVIIAGNTYFSFADEGMINIS
jgi:DNA repair protein RadC